MIRKINFKRFKTRYTMQTIQKLKIKFFKQNELIKKMKATIHKTGKIGFTMYTAERLSLSTGKSMSIGINESDSSDQSLYMILNDTVTEDSFRVSKAGLYYYLNTTVLLEHLKIDYKKVSFSYEITEESISGVTVLKFNRVENVPQIRNRKSISNARA